MKDIIKLYCIFFKIGIMTFGGGYAMLPMMQRELVNKYKWATDEEIMNYFAVGQCTPGVIAVNTATFIGYNHKGIGGAIGATLGVITPSLIIITVIATLIQAFSDIPAVGYAFAGINAAVSVLILNSVIKIWKSGVKNIFGGILFAVAFVLAAIIDVPTAAIVIASIFGGIVWEFISRHIKKGDKS